MVFKIDAEEKKFDSDSFNELFNQYRKYYSVSAAELESMLGEMLNLQGDKVHEWRFGRDYPDNIDIIKEIADCMELDDYCLLLKNTGSNTRAKLTERQKNSLKRIYESVVDFLDVFLQTEGFTKIWNSVDEWKGIKPYSCDFAQAEYHKLELSFVKEYIEIHSLDIYEKLESFIYDTVHNACISIGKTHYDDGIEKMSEEEYLRRISECYVFSIKEIKEIFEIYM